MNIQFVTGGGSFPAAGNLQTQAKVRQVTKQRTTGAGQNGVRELHQNKVEAAAGMGQMQYFL
jgi:hypothetical protein